MWPHDLNSMSVKRLCTYGTLPSRRRRWSRMMQKWYRKEHEARVEFHCKQRQNHPVGSSPAPLLEERCLSGKLCELGVLDVFKRLQVTVNLKFFFVGFFSFKQLKFQLYLVTFDINEFCVLLCILVGSVWCRHVFRFHFLYSKPCGIRGCVDKLGPTLFIICTVKCCSLAVKS